MPLFPFDLGELARRMATLGIEPEHVQQAIQPQAQKASWFSDLFAPMPTNESFPNARKAIDDFNNDPQIPGMGFLDRGSGQPAITPALNPPPALNHSLGQLMFPQGPPMSAMLGPEQGPPQDAMLGPQQGPPIGAMMEPQQQEPMPLLGAGGMPNPPDFTKGDAYSQFMQTVKDGGLTNPYGLAAVAATGSRESGWNPTRIAGSWNDPSESGVNGRSGGALSWRDARFDNLQRFAQENGLDPKAADTQAKFFLAEDPTLVQRLNSAKDAADAQNMMNQAWAFAGYDRADSPETKARFAAADKFAADFQAGKSGSPIGESGADSSSSSVSSSTSTSPTGADSATHGMTPTGRAPLSKRLGEMFKGLKAPENQKPKPPTGTAPPPQQGSFRPDPQSLQLILQMLGSGGGGTPQVGPTLGQLIGGDTRRR